MAHRIIESAQAVAGRMFGREKYEPDGISTELEEKAERMLVDYFGQKPPQEFDRTDHGFGIIVVRLNTDGKNPSVSVWASDSFEDGESVSITPTETKWRKADHIHDTEFKWSSGLNQSHLARAADLIVREVFAEAYPKFRAERTTTLDNRTGTGAAPEAPAP